MLFPSCFMFISITILKKHWFFTTHSFIIALWYGIMLGVKWCISVVKCQVVFKDLRFTFYASHMGHSLVLETVFKLKCFIWQYVWYFCLYTDIKKYTSAVEEMIKILWKGKQKNFLFLTTEQSVYRVIQNPMDKLQEPVGEIIWSIKCKYIVWLVTCVDSWCEINTFSFRGYIFVYWI